MLGRDIRRRCCSSKLQNARTAAGARFVTLVVAVTGPESIWLLADRRFRSSPERAAALPRWLHVYNVHRPHSALAGQPPISRLAMNNLFGNDT
jgi:transposase InsO family protein